MSLYFNWSCDFQRFTKSKKLSKFQVRTTTLFISNKSLSTSLFNLQGTICCFQRVFTTFSLFLTAHQQLIQYIKTRSVCQELFFKFFFRTSIGSKPNLSVLRSSLRDSFYRIPNPTVNIKSFFVPIRHLFLVSPHKTDYKSRNRQPCADR